MRWAPAVVAACCILGSAASRVPAQERPSRIVRVLPPAGIELSSEDAASLQRAVGSLWEEIRAVRDSGQRAALLPDVEIFAKAVDLALRHGEFYAPGDVATARQLLELGRQRLAEIRLGQAGWTHASGLVVRGFRSAVDGSAQPYGLQIPPALDLAGAQRVPLYVWLHGRSDKATDLHFIRRCMTQRGQIAPEHAIVLQPFGRYCNAFKFAGETDVLEAIEAVCQAYPIDRDRIVLWGFSMGGAGAWHLGAHYPDRFAAVFPGAGFADTRRYQNLSGDALPPEYEQILWGLYDVPPYVRNLFNLPVVAYSGERDKQIQAARLMEEAFAEHGQKLPHVIGPNTEHRYHAQSLEDLMRRAAAFARAGRAPLPAKVSLQTRTLRYSKAFWVQATRLEQHWHDARIDAEATENKQIMLHTQNVRSLKLLPPWPAGNADPMFTAATVLYIDGQRLPAPKGESLELTRGLDGRWGIAPPPEGRQKVPGLQGPIDDVWYEPFLVVLPGGHCTHAQVDRHVQSESRRFLDRWRELFRGEARVKLDRDVTAEDLAAYHLVVWGDPAANSVLRRALAVPGGLPLTWDEAVLRLAGQEYAAERHLPAMIYPNPLNPRKYIVLNSGLTFREGHDRTNSQQTPKLPDWAVLDVTAPPTDRAAGTVVQAGFFNEEWGLAK